MNFLTRLTLVTSTLFVFNCATAMGEWGKAPGGEDSYLADVNPEEAQRMLQEDSRVVLLDVRSRAEYFFIGHPAGAVNIPLKFWDEDVYDWFQNPDFGDKVQERFTKDTPIIAMCKTGGRSRQAANLLAGLGFTRVYNMIESFEGSADPVTGLRTANGWRNRGLPYTYQMNPELMYWP